MNLLSEHARELFDLPPEWDGYQFEIIVGATDQSAKLIRVRGAIAPQIARGKNKGKRNWRKRDKATECEAFFTLSEHDAWCRQWEKRTGLCSNCAGKGKLFLGWRAGEGTRFKLCHVCKGTGKTPNLGDDKTDTAPAQKRCRHQPFVGSSLLEGGCE